MPELPEPTVRPTRYTVSVLPEGFPEAWRWDLTVEQQRDSRWVIEHDGMYLTVQDRQWSASKVDAARVTGKSLAVDIARDHARQVTVNGLTPADALNRRKEQPDA